MSNLVVNKLSEFLSKVIKDYTKEHLNVSLLKGEIYLKDFEVDVNVINIYVEHYVPFLHFTKALVSDVKLSLPDVFHLSSKPTIIEIGHIDIECIERDFTKPPASELVEDDDWFLTSSADPDDKDNYGVIKKAIDGCRVETDCIHLKLFLNGLPSNDDKDQPTFHSNWFGKNVDPKKYCGPPLILDILLQNCVFQQTNHSWKCSNDLKYLRKSQGDRLKDFCVFKTFTAKSFNVTLMPHPQRIHTQKKRNKSKQKHESSAVFLLQNATLDVKLIFQRKATDGTLKTISTETYFKKLDFFMTQSQYFDLNYWIASLLYAQAQQYAFENPDLVTNREPSVSRSYSTTATATQTQTQSLSNIQRKDINKDKNSIADDEDKEAIESQHLSSGKLLFDAMSLCNPPRFQWNKIPIYTTVGFRFGRFSVHIMPDDWTFSIPVGKRRDARDKSQQQSMRRQRSSSHLLMREIGSKTALGVNVIGKQLNKTAKGMGSVAKGVTHLSKKGATHMAKGVGTFSKGIKKSVTKKGPPSAKPPPLPSAASTSAHTTPEPYASRASANKKASASTSHIHMKRDGHKRSEYVHKTDAMHHNKYASHHTLSESKLGALDRDFLLECHMIPKVAITKITVGDEFNYEPLISDKQESVKPLVIAIFSNFSLGMIFPDLGYSIWRTRIGRSRAEQFFSVQVGDLDLFADTQLKEQLQHQLKTGIDAAVSQLRKEQEIIDAEKEKEFTPDPQTEESNTKSESNLKPVKTKTRARSQSDPNKARVNDEATEEESKSMTLIVSSRHYKNQTVTFKPFKFTISQPFEGYNPHTMSVFNYQWTRRIPAPQSVLAQMSDMHIKPLVIYLDPFLVFNCVKLFAGNGVIRVYRMQAALSTFTVIFERFASRYLFDAVRIIIPINPTSSVTAAIHNLRLSSHDKLDNTVHERGLVDLSNFSSVGKHSLRTMGLADRIVDEIQKTKEKYVQELKEESYFNGTRFSSHYDHKLKAAIAPAVSRILRPPDEYPWEINIGHFSLASVVHLEDQRYDNEIQVLNCRMRYVMIRSDSMQEDDDDEEEEEFGVDIGRPFVETQVSFRTDSIEGSIDTTVIDEVLKQIDFGGIAELPLPALFNKIRAKMADKQQRREMERKIKKENRNNNNNKEQKEKEEEKEAQRLKKQQKRRRKLLKEKKDELDDKIVADDLLLSEMTNKHQDVREIEISDSEDDDDDAAADGLDLDSFIEGVLDGIGGNESSSGDTRNKEAPVTPTPKPNVADDESDSGTAPVAECIKNNNTGIEYRLMVYSNLDRGEFQITNNGKTNIKGKTRSQQLLLQWTEDILNFHFFSTELKLYESPIGKYQEHDVVTRFSRSKDGRMWSEVVHDEPDGAIELTFPPSLERIVDKMKNEKQEEEEVAVALKRDKTELMDLVRYITVENRVMQTRVLQLASDLSVSRDDMKRFVKQTSEDKIRIVEHQQYLVNDNMELQKQVQLLKKRIRELELARNMHIRKK